MHYSTTEDYKVIQAIVFHPAYEAALGLSCHFIDCKMDKNVNMIKPTLLLRHAFLFQVITIINNIKH